jgi:hypothetical protein
MIQNILQTPAMPGTTRTRRAALLKMARFILANLILGASLTLLLATLLGGAGLICKLVWICFHRGWIIL